MSGTTLYVPRDSSAVSVGADAVAERIAAEARSRGAEVRIVRTSSRGLYWLEPFVEVQTASGRVAYGPVTPQQIGELFASDWLHGGDHALRLGKPEEIPYLKSQQRLVFARAGITDPTSLEDFVEHGGFRALRAALAMTPQRVVDEISRSGLRGRGGAAFPAGIKWKTVLDQAAPEKYVVCNADEGDSGSFSDRMVMEGDPFLLIEGMTIAALAVGARRGFIYLRSEYPPAAQALGQAIATAGQHGYLGEDVLASGKAFHLELRIGAGSYICGEETAMLESLEGRRGIVRAKPPVPAVQGLFGRPTLIHNVISFASVPTILQQGADHYASLGVGRSRGTLPVQLAGNIRRAGLVEIAFGATLRELLYGYGGGAASGRPIKAVQVGGPLGAYLAPSEFDLPLDYEALAGCGAMVGHGGIVAFDDTADMARMARYAMEFCAIESCGKCTPCRIGSRRGVEVIERLLAAEGEEKHEAARLLRELCDTMLYGSLCAMGGMTPAPVLSALEKFPEDFGLAREAVPQ